jgi:hypothetical protein
MKHTGMNYWLYSSYLADSFHPDNSVHMFFRHVGSYKRYNPEDGIFQDL